MNCEEIVEKIQGEEYEQILTCILQYNAPAKQKALNQVKRLDLQANQIYRTKLLRLLKKQVHQDSEAKLYRHPNRTRN